LECRGRGNESNTGHRLLEFGMVEKNDAGSNAEHHYFREIVTYNDGETSGNRVFKDREKAEEWAARQEKSPVVKKTVIVPFVRQQYGGRRVSKSGANS
jgi:hypothetical protein